MEIKNEFTIGAPPDRAFALLVDLDQVVPCLPGAELGGELADGSRAVKVRVKLGPMRFTYEGSVRITDRDTQAHRAVLTGQAKETRGQGDATATITMGVLAADGGSRVESVAQVDLTGRAAQMGHGVVEAVAGQLMGQMATTIETRLAEGGGSTTEHGAGSPRVDGAPNAAPTDTPALADQASRPDAGAPKTVPAAAPISGGRLVLAAITAWLVKLSRRGFARRRST